MMLLISSRQKRNIAEQRCLSDRTIFPNILRLESLISFLSSEKDVRARVYSIIDNHLDSQEIVISEKDRRLTIAPNSC